ncbi:E4 [Macaca mulatta papillomavirus 4]|uniref:E4 n=1 Tax=Macaca mulatta papillomavirus 4 TaxID=2294152 RepID=A0A385AHG8_9PAPI|nr:E4 [Macaca mulatta papillomavirus 4]AXN57298.1 E4 [Macaca mulatta papillomavirus 4]
MTMMNGRKCQGKRTIMDYIMKSQGTKDITVNLRKMQHNMDKQAYGRLDIKTILFLLLLPALQKRLGLGPRRGSLLVPPDTPRPTRRLEGDGGRYTLHLEGARRALTFPPPSEKRLKGLEEEEWDEEDNNGDKENRDPHNEENPPAANEGASTSQTPQPDDLLSHLLAKLGRDIDQLKEAIDHDFSNYKTKLGIRQS